MKRRTKMLITVLVPLMFVSGTAMADNYGVIFSGGVDKYNNHTRYYEETHRIWDIMTGTLGYDVDKVYVLAADGLSTDDDQRVSAGVYIDSDWNDIVTAGGNIDAGTSANLETTLENLEDIMGADDCFHFWSFDHGYNETYRSDPPTPATLDLGGLCAWDPTRTDYLIADDEFAKWVEPINAYAESYVFGQCFAGDMVDDLNIVAGENRFAAWAADWYEPSYGKGWVDVWADALEAGLRWTHELGEYAKLWDPYAGSEHPGWLGDNFHIITNEPVPLPGAVLLGMLGLSFAGAKLRKKNA
jgi:hypothetical protein